MKINWEKLAAALLAAALLLAGWGLWKIDIIDERTTRIEAKIEIWHTPVSSAAMLAGGKGYPSCEQNLEFARRAMVKSYNDVKAHEYDRALKTLMVGLDASGWRCREHRDRLECER